MNKTHRRTFLAAVGAALPLVAGKALGAPETTPEPSPPSECRSAELAESERLRYETFRVLIQHGFEPKTVVARVRGQKPVRCHEVTAFFEWGWASYPQPVGNVADDYLEEVLEETLWRKKCAARQKTILTDAEWEFRHRVNLALIAALPASNALTVSYAAWRDPDGTLSAVEAAFRTAHGCSESFRHQVGAPFGDAERADLQEQIQLALVVDDMVERLAKAY